MPASRSRSCLQWKCTRRRSGRAFQLPYPVEWQNGVEFAEKVASGLYQHDLKPGHVDGDSRHFRRFLYRGIPVQRECDVASLLKIGDEELGQKFPAADRLLKIHVIDQDAFHLLELAVGFVWVPASGTENRGFMSVKLFYLRCCESET